MSTNLYLDINLNPGNFLLGNYNIAVDNGNRFNGYLVNTDIGHNYSDNNIAIVYGSSLDIPVLVSPSPTLVVELTDVDFYNGLYGWENASTTAVLGSGTSIASATFTNGVNGKTPYYTNNASTTLTVATAGYFILDYNITGASALVTPFFYLIDQSTNRVIKAAQGPQASFGRIITYLPIGTYTLVLTALETNPGLTGTYHVYAYGPIINPAPFFMYPGYSQGGTINPVFTLTIASFKVTLKNLERESCVNLSVLNHNLTQLQYVIPTQIYIAPANIGLLIPEVMLQTTNYISTVLRVAETCCFSNKLSLDIPNLCVIPSANKE
jgi:hypothetical protein